jgi:CBS domain-containing protein
MAMKATTVRDVMTPSVVAVREEADFKEMVHVMRNHRISAFPVLDAANRVTGVVSEADLLLKEAALELPQGTARLAWRAKERSKAVGLTAAEVMTTPAVTIGEDAPVAEAARVMKSRKVKRLPVVDGNRRLRGIISRADVLSVYGRPDDEIGGEITENVIPAEFRSGPGRFTVTVKDGIVTLEGSLATVRQGRDILARIWRVEGVVSVRDRLTYPEGM